MKTIIFTYFFFLMVIPGISQKVNIELSTGNNQGELVFGRSGKIKNQSPLKDPLSHYTLGISGQIYKNFYFKTEVGTIAMKNFIKVQYTEDFAGTPTRFEFFGWYRSEQIYMAFLPEFRHDFGTKQEGLFYINLGLGVNRYLNQQFINGYRASDRFPMVNLVDLNDQLNYPDNHTSFLFNVGLNPKIKTVGFLFNVGYHRIKPPSTRPGLPVIGSRQWIFRMGVSYSIE